MQTIIKNGKRKPSRKKKIVTGGTKISERNAKEPRTQYNHQSGEDNAAEVETRWD